MSRNRWLGAQGLTAQVVTVQITAADVTTTYKITMGSRVVSVLGLGSASLTAAALQAALAASSFGEFAEVTWSVSTDTVTGTARTAGTPFTATSSVSGGAGTIGSVTTTTANKSPNDFNDAVNWSAGTVPAGTEDVDIDNSSIPIWWNLGALSAVTLTSLNIPASYSGAIGLPEVNSLGSNSFEEYRATYLAIAATTVNVGVGSGPGIGRLKLNTGTAQTTINLWLTGGALDATPGEVFLWKGTHASNVVNNYRGSFAAGAFAGELATIATFRNGFVTDQASDALSRMGGGCTLTTVTIGGGQLEMNSAATTVNLDAGVLTTQGSGAITTLNATSGTHNHLSSGTITTYNMGPAALNCPSDVAQTITTLNAKQNGGVLVAPRGRLTLTNGIVPATTVNLSTWQIEVGAGRTYTIT